MFKQSEAVSHFTKQVLGASFQDGVDVKSYITEDQKQQVIDCVTSSIMENGTKISDEAKAKYSDQKSLRRYVAGMVTNWFNKSPGLNGGGKYETKAPGTRKGSQDEVVKNLRILKKQLTEAGNTQGLAEVESALAERLSQLEAAKPRKAKATKPVDESSIPEHLRDLIGAA